MENDAACCAMRILWLPCTPTEQQTLWSQNLTFQLPTIAFLFLLKWTGIYKNTLSVCLPVITSVFLPTCLSVCWHDMSRPCIKEWGQVREGEGTIQTRRHDRTRNLTAKVEGHELNSARQRLVGPCCVFLFRTLCTHRIAHSNTQPWKLQSQRYSQVYIWNTLPTLPTVKILK